MNPTFGQRGDAVKAYQRKLNEQNQGVAGFTPLVVDGIFGAKTQAASNFQIPSTTPLPSSVSTKATFQDLALAKPVMGDLNTQPVPPVDTTSPKSNAEIVLAQQNQKSTAQQNQDKTFEQIFKDLSSLENKAVDNAAALEQSGFNTSKKVAQDIANQILANTAATQAEKLAIGGNVGGITTADRGGFESKIERERAIKNLNLTAQLQAAQGNMALAKETADAAINAKYAPIETRLANLKEFYTLNKDNLDREQKKNAELTNARLKDLEIKKADEKDVNSIAIEIAKNGGDASIVSGAKNLSEAIQKAGSALRTPSTEIVKLGDNQAYLIDKNTGKIIRSFGGGRTGATVGTVKNTSNTEYTGVVNTILASGKFTKDQTVAIRNAINNGEDPVTVIKNNAKNIMGQTEANTLSKYEAAKSSLADLESALKQYYAKGGKTNLLSGKYENVLNNLGSVKDPELVDIATQIAAQIQVYRNAVSGTAYSVQEGKQIDSVFPGINKTEGLNKAIISGRKKAFDSAIDNTYKTTLGDAYNKIKSAQIKNAKGNLSDKDFVAKAVSNFGKDYQTIINETKENEIPVVDNKTGQIGYIIYTDFNSDLYTKL